MGVPVKILNLPELSSLWVPIALLMLISLMAVYLARISLK